MEVERSGRIEGFEDWDAALPLAGGREETIPYAVVPESDLNALGQVYCARFPAVMDYGERVLLRERLERPLSAPLVARLSPELRRIYYFANADPHETLTVRLQAQVMPAPASKVVTRLRTPARLLFRIDLSRGSDGVLMASSLVRKALKIPGQLKSVLTEADRWLGGLANATS